MSDHTVKDYLGHPCRFTEAKTLFSEPFDKAQTLEQRQIKRDVGALLLSLSERLSHALNASHALCRLAQSADDADGLHALLEMLAAYEMSTSNIFYDFAGRVLAGFEDATANTAGSV
jgi:hypothetical protein